MKYTDLEIESVQCSTAQTHNEHVAPGDIIHHQIPNPHHAMSSHALSDWTPLFHATTGAKCIMFSTEHTTPKVSVVGICLGS